MTPRIFLAALALLAACTSGTSRNPVGTDAIGPGYTLSGGEFDTGSKIILAVAPRDIGGRLAICGARIEDRSSTLVATAAESVLEGSRIEVGGRTVLTRLANFQPVPFSPNVTGAPTNCFLTEESWSPTIGQLEVVIPLYQQRHSQESVTIFRQGPVPQIIGAPPQVAPDAEPAPNPGQWQVAK